MKNIVLSFVLLLLLPAFSNAQKQTEVKKSEIIEKIDGKDFYIHFVKEGQNVASIAKAYECTAEELTTLNPELKKGIRSKQILKIPAKNYPETKQAEKNRVSLSTKTVVDKVTDNYIYHVVQEKETIFGITKKYNISEQELLENNPDLATGLKIDAVIKIPVKTEKVIETAGKAEVKLAKADTKVETKPAKTETVTKSTSIVSKPENKIAETKTSTAEGEPLVYQVAEKETLYSISKKFGVSVDQIEEANPELKSGLKKGQKIFIPSKNKGGVKTATTTVKNVEKPVVQKAVEEVVPEINTVEKPATRIKSANSGCNENGKNETYRVALMLPLYLKEVDSINISSLDRLKPPSAYRSMNFIQFYEGAMIAVDSLKSQGLKVKFYVYDVDEDTSKTGVLLRKPEVKQMDLIVGPLYSRNFKKVSQFAKKYDIPIVNPLSQRSEIIENNPKVYKVVPSSQTGLEYLSRYNVSNFAKSNVLVIRYPKTNETAALFSAFKTEFAAARKGKPGGFKEVNNINEIIKSLMADRENVIFALSENKAFVFNLLNKLNDQRNICRMTLYGMPEWNDMDIDVAQAINLNLHLYQPSFVDYNDPKIQCFIRQFRSVYKTVPEENKYAFSGFDITWYFLNALFRYGKDFEHCLPDMNVSTLGTNFDFQSSGNNGFENKAAFIIRYKDYKLENVTPSEK